MFERLLAEEIGYVAKSDTDDSWCHLDEVLFRNSPCPAQWLDLHHAFPGPSS